MAAVSFDLPSPVAPKSRTLNVLLPKAGLGCAALSIARRGKKLPCDVSATVPAAFKKSRRLNCIILILPFDICMRSTIHSIYSFSTETFVNEPRLCSSGLSEEVISPAETADERVSGAEAKGCQRVPSRLHHAVITPCPRVSLSQSGPFWLVKLPILV